MKILKRKVKINLATQLGCFFCVLFFAIYSCDKISDFEPDTVKVEVSTADYINSLECKTETKTVVVGQGNEEVKHIKIASDTVDKILIYGAFEEVDITQGDVNSLTISGYSNLLNEINTSSGVVTYVTSNQLSLILPESKCFKNSNLKANIIVKDLTDIAIVGNVKKVLVNQFNTSVNVNLYGLVNFDASDSLLEDVSLKATGVGKVIINYSSSLSGTIEGIIDLSYRTSGQTTPTIENNNNTFLGKKLGSITSY